MSSVFSFSQEKLGASVLLKLALAAVSVHIASLICSSKMYIATGMTPPCLFHTARLYPLQSDIYFFLKLAIYDSPMFVGSHINFCQVDL